MKEILAMQLVEGGPTKPFEASIESVMQRDIEHFTQEAAKLRTGRANPAIIEDLIVACYGSGMKLKEIASISAPDAQLLVIQPWDTNLISDIEKAINQSDLGINPANDGALIRLALPRMSTERREELVKVLLKKLEECRVAIRNAREAVRKITRDAEKNRSISEDYAKRLNDILQKITNKYIENAEKLSAKKEPEIRSL